MKKFVVMVSAFYFAFSGCGMNSGHFTESKLRKSGGNLARLNVTSSGHMMKPNRSSSDGVPLSPSHSGKITRYDTAHDEILQNLQSDNINSDKIIKLLNQNPNESGYRDIYITAVQKGISQVVAWPFLPENVERLPINVLSLLSDICKMSIDIEKSQNQVSILTAIFDTGIFQTYPQVLRELGSLTQQQMNKNKVSSDARKIDVCVKNFLKKK